MSGTGGRGGEPGPEAEQGHPGAPAPPAGGAPNLDAIFKSAGYLRLLALCAVVGIPVSVAGYWFVQLFDHLQVWLFQDLPHALGFTSAPQWWPFPMLVIGGILVGLSLRYLPGRGGHSPADGFTAGQPQVIELPGILLASLASLAFGVVLGPEAPLISLGTGMGLIAARYVLPKAPPMASRVVGAAGAFASLGTIFGSPLVAAIFLMEGIGMGGDMLTMVLIPGLLAAGLGALVFVGLGSWSGLGAASLALPQLPHFAHPTWPQLGWCVVIGAAAALLAWGLRALALVARRLLRRWVLWGPVVAGLVIAGLVVAFTHASGKPEEAILFSGQFYLGPLVSQRATWTVEALLLLVVFKTLSYSVSLSSFRGGPVFPALLVGAAGGMVAAHLPGFSLVPGLAAGMGAMTAAMLRLPLASVLLPSLLLVSSGVGVTPLIIVAVVVAYLITRQLPLPYLTSENQEDTAKDSEGVGAPGAQGA